MEICLGAPAGVNKHLDLPGLRGRDSVLMTVRKTRNANSNLDSGKGKIRPPRNLRCEVVNCTFPAHPNKIKRHRVKKQGTCSAVRSLARKVDRYP